MVRGSRLDGRAGEYWRACDSGQRAGEFARLRTVTILERTDSARYLFPKRRASIGLEEENDKGMRSLNGKLIVR